MGVEGLFESRPLMYQFVDPRDDVPLTRTTSFMAKLQETSLQRMLILRRSTLASIGEKCKSGFRTYGAGGRESTYCH